MSTSSSVSSGVVRQAILAFLILSIGLLLTGCQGLFLPANNQAPEYTGYLFMTDTTSGAIQWYDPVAKKVSTTTPVNIGQNATGNIRFYKGIAYVCVGSWNNSKPGLYRFDPASTTATATQIGSNISAQYVAFLSTTKAYVSAADFSSATGTGIYSFNPSNPEAGLVGPLVGTGTKFLQQVVIGADSKLYVADNLSGSVIRIDTQTDTIEATFTTSAAGTTGLSAGSLGGVNGVFVANNGNYAGNGTVDFIPVGLAVGATPTSVVDKTAGVHPLHIAYLPNGNLVTTGYDETALLTLNAGAYTAAQLKTADSKPISGTDVAVKNGLVYIAVADYTKAANQVYVFDSTGIAQTGSPVTVLNGDPSKKGTLTLASIAFWQ